METNYTREMVLAPQSFNDRFSLLCNPRTNARVLTLGGNVLELVTNNLMTTFSCGQQEKGVYVFVLFGLEGEG